MKLCKCGRIVKGKCDYCYRDTRGTTAERGYDHAWRVLSERVRQDEPLCPDCTKEGRAVPTTEVHHIVKITDAPWLRLERSNLIALCRKHHEERERANG